MTARGPAFQREKPRVAGSPAVPRDPSAAAVRSHERGVVLALVLVLALLLSVSMISFTRRAVVDTMIIRNRDQGAQAAALARGGLRLAIALLVEDRVAKQLQALDPGAARPATPGNTTDDLWSRIGDFQLVDAEGGRLTLEIHDSGSLLNLNAVVPYTGEEAPPDPDAEEFLVAFFDKVIDEMPIDPGEKLYDSRELARNLIDWMDLDGIRMVGGDEDEYYLSQDAPYRASNGPLLSVEELGLIEGFDVQLVESLRHYVTVYPIVGGSGINLNTAPPHVLALVYHGVSGDKRLASEYVVGRILRLRDEGQIICTASSPEQECLTLNEVDLGEGGIFPDVKLPDESDTFTIRARASVGEIERTLFAVIDRSELTQPQLLFWRMQ